MKDELLQPTATIVAALINLRPVLQEDLKETFVQTYRLLEAAKEQIELKDQSSNPPSAAPLRI